MKRCPKCGRSYEDYWKVCLEDGVPLVEMKTIHKPHEMGTFKSLSKKEEEEERRQMVSFFFALSMFLALVTVVIVTIFSGNPFSVIRNHEKISILQTIIYNAGALTGIFITGAVLTLPVSLLWWRRR